MIIMKYIIVDATKTDEFTTEFDNKETAIKEAEQLTLTQQKQKEIEARKKATSNVVKSVVKTTGSTVGREIGKTIGGTVGGSFGKRLGGNIGSTLGRGVLGSLFKG